MNGFGSCYIALSMRYMFFCGRFTWVEIVKLDIFVNRMEACACWFFMIWLCHVFGLLIGSCASTFESSQCVALLAVWRI